MTSGDPTAPKPTVGSRQASHTVAKKPGRLVKGGGAASAAGNGKEPRVSVAKAGAGALKRITKGDAAATNDDVLERLARLGESTTAPPADDSIGLPPIVEADPTFPPIERPAEARQLPDDEPSPSTDAATIAATDAATEALTLTASAPSTLPASTVVSADLPTAAVAAPAAPDADAASPAVSPAALSPAALAPDRTEVVPSVPTEPMVPAFVPDPPAIPEAAPSVTDPVADTGDGTGDGTGSVTLPLRRLRTPVVFRRAKPRVRRVTRVVRHVDTWSVFKVALVFNVILYLCCLTSGVLLWNVAHATGTIDNIEKFFEQFGWESFEFKGGEIYHNAWIGGLFVAIGLTGFVVLIATLFNLITDLVGGIRVSVLEEEVVARPRQGDPTGGVPRP